MEHTNSNNGLPEWFLKARAEYLKTPPTPVDPDAPLKAGDLRRLNPLPDDPHTEAMLVLVADDPYPDDLPDDITDVPGPCHIVHVIPVESPRDFATDRDILLPVEDTGTAFALHAITDLFTTIRLDPDDPDGRRRFGPKIGNALPPSVGALGWTAHTLPPSDLIEHVADQTGYTLGDLRPQSGDWMWEHRIRQCRNLNRLTGWW